MLAHPQALRVDTSYNVRAANTTTINVPLARPKRVGNMLLVVFAEELYDNFLCLCSCHREQRTNI
jgi:hypothetical protein